MSTRPAAEKLPAISATPSTFRSGPSLMKGPVAYEKRQGNGSEFSMSHVTTCQHAGQPCNGGVPQVWPGVQKVSSACPLSTQPREPTSDGINQLTSRPWARPISTPRSSGETPVRYAGRLLR